MFGKTSFSFGDVVGLRRVFFWKSIFQGAFWVKFMFLMEICYSDTGNRIKSSQKKKSTKNHGKRMRFHRFYEHHKSFIEFWSVSALFHFTKSGSTKSETHVCFCTSYDPIEKYDHHKHAFSLGNNAFLVSIMIL